MSSCHVVCLRQSGLPKSNTNCAFAPNLPGGAGIQSLLWLQRVCSICIFLSFRCSVRCFVMFPGQSICFPHAAFHFGAGWEINQFERHGLPPLYSEDDDLIILLGLSEVSREDRRFWKA